MYDKAEAKILQGRSLFNLVISVGNALLCMFQRLWTYFKEIGVLIFFFWGGGYVLLGHCSRQQISEKNEGYLFSEGYLFTGFYGILENRLFSFCKIHEIEMLLVPFCFSFFWKTSLVGKQVCLIFHVWHLVCCDR